MKTMKNNPWLNWYFVTRVLGFVLSLEALFIFLSAAISFYYKDWDVPYILISGGITLLFGIIFILLGPKNKANKNIGKREGFLTVTLSWLLFSIFGTIPYYISGAIPSITDAFFETMSGITTTGSSILTNVEALPKGLLLWRSITQWLGGMGMIVFSLALLPLLGGGAVQLFDAETTGITHEKFRPRVGQVAKRLWIIYSLLTFILFLLLYIGPMDFFDAICHSLVTLSTGGYSTKQNSIAFWNSSYVDYTIVLFMIIGSINFSLIYFLFTGNVKKVWKDEELRWYLIIILSATLLVTIYLVKDLHISGHVISFRTALFQVVSIISTTGFATGDYVSWGPFYWIIFLMLMLVCGCASSTSGGLKIVRLVVLIKNTLNEFRKLLHPRAIVPVRLNGTVLSSDMVQKVIAFVFLYIVLILISGLFFTLTGMNFEEALGASVTSISNTGPGLGKTGPTGCFADIPDISKWYMAFLMLIGRLEIFTVLTLFTPGFWKK